VTTPLKADWQRRTRPRTASARWSEIHPDRLTSNWMEAQSQLNRIEWGNHEKGKEARQIQEFIETTS
jgi:hypothetical protein